jgi:subtilisin family serine protease
MAEITINGITLDPAAQEPALAAANLLASDASNTAYILVQTEQPLDRAQKDELADKGVDILEYVPSNTYLCKYEPTDLDEIRALPYVAWANVYMQGFKIAPELVEVPPDRPGVHNLLTMTAETERIPNNTPTKVDVVFQRGVDPEAVRDKVATATRMDREDLELRGQKVRLTVPTKYLPDLANIDEVRHVEQIVPYKLHNDVARRILRVELDASGSDPAFEGEGQVVAVADTGFDRGSTTNVHPAFQDRVANLYALGRPNNANDPNGHGTHVAGSVLGDGTSERLGGSIRGTAPHARLVLQSVLDRFGELGGLPDDLHDLFGTPYEEDGARIHTNSWGSIVGDGSYNQNSFELDDFVWNHRDCVICFSAGNEGTDRNANGQIDAMTITPPGTAKNCITVGANENERPTFDDTYGDWWPGDFPVDPSNNDKMADNSEGMVAFSGRGPTRAQRIKPDVVAPGTFILSTRSRATVDDGWAPSADPLYYHLGGTSMATPLVAGCVALVREYLVQERTMPEPSAALVKAMLINGARNIAGQHVPSEAGVIPNHAEGFGRVDVAATIGPFAPGEDVILNDESTALDSGEEERTTVTVTPNTASLKVTLVWTDPPGEALQNDLDLVVRTADRQERHGNRGLSSSGFDRFNNVEQVFWTSVPAGDAEIIVRAHRVTQLPQTYALVVRTT